MNREQLPKENEMCYVTVKIDPNTEIEELGYLTSYPVEPRKFKENLGYYDDDTDLFRHFSVTVPIIECDFPIEDLVSWRGIKEIVSEPVKHFVLADHLDEGCSEVIGTADFWTTLPTTPNKK